MSSSGNVPEKLEAKVWRAIIAATATIGAVGVALGLGSPLVSAVMSDYGISSSVIGYSGTVGGIATVSAAACTPHIATRYGVVKPILAMLLIGALSFLGFYCFQGIWIWFSLRFVLHFAMTVMFVLSEFWVNSSAPPARRGFVLAIYAITLGLGFTAGSTLFTFVGSKGFAPFGIGCALIAVASIPIFAAWKLGPKFHDSEHVPFLPYILKVPTSTMAVLVYGAVQMGAVTLITSFGIDLGLDEKDAGRLLMFLALGNVLLLVPIGLISDRIKDRRYTLMACAFIGLVGTLVVPWIANTYYLLCIDLFILGGVSAGLYTVGLAQLGTRLNSNELAAANAAFIFCYGIGMLIGPSLIGQAMDLSRPYGFSYAMALFFGLYVALVLIRLIEKLFRS